MAVTYEGGAEYTTYGGGAVSFTSHSLTANDHKFCVIWISVESDIKLATEGTVTFGGLKCFRMHAGEQASAVVSGVLYGIFVPTSWSGTKTVAATLPSTYYYHIIVQTYNDVLTWRHGTFNFGNGSTTAPSINITSVSGDLVVDFLVANNTTDTGWNPTAGTGQTRDTWSSSRPGVCSSHETATGTSTTMSWSWSTSYNQVQVGFSLIPWASPTKPYISHTGIQKTISSGTTIQMTEINTYHRSGGSAAMIAWIGVHGSGVVNAATATLNIASAGDVSMTRVVQQDQSASGYCYGALFILHDISEGDAVLDISWTGTASAGQVGWAVVDWCDPTSAVRDSNGSKGNGNSTITMPTIYTTNTDLAIAHYYGRGYLRNDTLSGTDEIAEGTYSYSNRSRESYIQPTGSPFAWTWSAPAGSDGWVCEEMSLKAPLVEGEVSTGNATYSTTSRTFTHNNDGENLLIYVCFGESSAPTDCDVVFGGYQATSICSYSSYWYGELWIVRNAPIGSYTVTISSTNNTGTLRGAIALSILGMKKAVPTNYNGYDFLSSTPSRDVTSSTGCLVVDFLMGRAWTAATPGTGQSPVYALYCSKEAGASTVTMSWSGLTENRGNQIGVSLEPDDGTGYNWATLPTVGNTGSGTSSPLSFNNNSSDMLAVGLFDGEGSLAVVTGVTFNSVAMTQLTTENDGYWLGEIWYLKSPPVGTYNIAVTCSSGTVAEILAASIIGSLDTPTPYDVYATTGNYFGINLAANTYNMVLEMTFGRAAARTPISGQTVLISNLMAWRRGSEDYWARYNFAESRSVIAAAAFKYMPRGYPKIIMV
jgi:hypothetical protein